MNARAMVLNRNTSPKSFILGVLFLVAAAYVCRAQECFSGTEIDAQTARTVQSAAQQYFDMSAQGDVAGLKADAVPDVAANFGGIEQAVVADKQLFAQGHLAETRSFVLDARNSKTTWRLAEFYCGIYNSPDRVGFAIPNLPPGRYAVTIAKVTGKEPITLTMILEDAGKSTWKLAGYYARLNSIGGHDGQWFLTKAREYKAKGSVHNAWFYYLTTWDLIAPVDFMSTPALDQLSDELQAARPADMPSAAAPLVLIAGGKTFKITDVAAVPVGDELGLRVQYETADASNPVAASQDNMAVMKALLAKYPELRDAFTTLIARASDGSGREYGTLTPIKDVK
jgi:hypothetical protein